MIKPLSTEQQEQIKRVLESNPTAALGRVIQALQKEVSKQNEQPEESSGYDPARHSAWGEE